MHEQRLLPDVPHFSQPRLQCLRPGFGQGRLAPPLRPLTPHGKHVQDPVLAGDAPVLSGAQLSEIVQAVAPASTAQTRHSSTREGCPLGTFEGKADGAMHVDPFLARSHVYVNSMKSHPSIRN
jgi:hypothetical protein